MLACTASALCILLAACAQSPTEQGGGPAAASGSPTRHMATLRGRSGETRQNLFERLDTNHDGTISRTEASADPDLVAVFVSVDANGDDAVSPLEFAVVPISFGGGPATTDGLQARGGETRQQVFDRIDVNGDGSISRAEADVDPQLAAIFARAVANGDGARTTLEFVLVPIGVGVASASTGAMHAQQGMSRRQVFDQLDANHDGMISRAESRASPELVAIFGPADGDSDGMLTITEFAVVPITFDGGTSVGATGAASGSGSRSVGY
jgi:Ca2+-binding EF-hand superfamily protein